MKHFTINLISDEETMRFLYGLFGGLIENKEMNVQPDIEGIEKQLIENFNLTNKQIAELRKEVIDGIELISENTDIRDEIINGYKKLLNKYEIKINKNIN